MYNILDAAEKTIRFISIHESLLYALIGFAVTFLGTVILIFCVWLMGKIMNVANKRVKKVEKKTTDAVSDVKNDVAIQEGISEEVVVAITAAIAMYYEGEKSSCEFKVKRIKRL